MQGLATPSSRRKYNVPLTYPLCNRNDAESQCLGDSGVWKTSKRLRCKTAWSQQVCRGFATHLLATRVLRCCSPAVHAVGARVQYPAHQCAESGKTVRPVNQRRAWTASTRTWFDESEALSFRYATANYFSIDATLLWLWAFAEFADNGILSERQRAVLEPHIADAIAWTLQSSIMAKSPLNCLLMTYGSSSESER